MRKFIAITWIVLLASGIVLAQDQQQEAQQADEERAGLRIVHLALGSGDVDVRIDDEVRLPGVVANTASGYMFVAPGEHTISAVRVGGAPAQPAETEDGTAQDPATQDPATQPPADPAAPGAQTEEGQPAPDAEVFSTTVNLEPGTYTTIVVLDVGTEGEQAAEGSEADTQQQEGAEGQAQMPQEVQDAQASIDEARTALDEDDAEGARQALETARERIGAALEQAGEEMQSALEDVRASIDEALQALDNDDLEGARQSLEGVEEQMAAVNESAQQQEQTEGTQDDDQQQAAQSGQRVEVVVVQDQLPTLPAANTATVRLVNVSRGGNLDLVGVLQREADEQEGEEQAEQTEEDVAPPVQGEDRFTGLGDLSFGAAAEYQEVPAATYHLQVQGQNGTVRLDLPDTILEPGVVYTFYASSTAEGDVLVTISVDGGVNRVQN